MPKLFSDPEAIAEDIIRDVGTRLAVGLPLGLGKANHIVGWKHHHALALRFEHNLRANAFRVCREVDRAGGACARIECVAITSSFSTHFFRIMF
jgi:hypothetical protein